MLRVHLCVLLCLLVAAGICVAVEGDYVALGPAEASIGDIAAKATAALAKTTNTLNASKSPEKLRTIWMNGGAPITIDGAVEDWNGITAPRFEIATPYPGRTSGVSLPPTKDLSASFWCFADANRLYVRVDVADDRLVFGRQAFQDIWADDSVVIGYAGDFPKTGALQLFGEHDGRIVISRDSFGHAITSDWTPLGDGSWEAKPQFQKLPGFWEALGVESAIATNSTGYVVEVAIPFEVLGSKEGQKPDEVGINVKVFDNDTGEGLGEDVIGWTVDPRNSSLDSSRGFRSVAFDAVGAGLKAKSPKSSHYSSLKKALQFMRKKDWQRARWALWETPADNCSYALMTKIDVRSNKLEDRSSHFLQALAQCQDPHLAGWFLEGLAQVRMEQKQFIESRRLYERLGALNLGESAKRAQAGLVELAWREGGEAAATDFLNSLERKSPQAILAHAARLKGDPAKAIALLRSVADQPGVFVTFQADALLSIQRIYCRLKDFDAAHSVALELQMFGEDTSAARIAGLDLLKLVNTIQQKRLRQKVPPLADEYASTLGKRAWVGPVQTLELAQLLVDSARLDEAVTRFQQVLEMSVADNRERARALVGLEQVAVRKGDWANCLTLAETLEENFPNELEARGLSVGMLHFLSSPEAGSGQATRSTEISTRFKQHLLALSKHERLSEAGYASHFLGGLLMSEGRVSEAEAHLRTCAEKFPASKTYGMTLFLLAGILEMKEKWTEAISVRERLADVKDPETEELTGAMNLRILADLYLKFPEYKGGFGRMISRIMGEYPDSFTAHAINNGLRSSPLTNPEGGAR